MTGAVVAWPVGSTASAPDWAAARLWIHVRPSDPDAVLEPIEAVLRIVLDPGQPWLRHPDPELLTLRRRSLNLRDPGSALRIGARVLVEGTRLPDPVVCDLVASALLVAAQRHYDLLAATELVALVQCLTTGPDGVLSTKVHDRRPLPPGIVSSAHLARRMRRVAGLALAGCCHHATPVSLCTRITAAHEMDPLLRLGYRRLPSWVRVGQPSRPAATLAVLQDYRATGTTNPAAARGKRMGP